MSEKLSSPAQKLWDLTEEYVKLALEHLEPLYPQQSKSSEARFNGAAERLRVKLLFPHFKPEAQAAFLQARCVRLQARAALKPETLTTSNSDSLTEEPAQAFSRVDESKKRIEQHFSHLTPVQHEITVAHYLSI